MSFGGVPWFALLPFSMQGTLSVSAPAKQTSRGGQGEQQEAHCRQAGRCLGSRPAQPHAGQAARLRHKPHAPASPAPRASRAIGTHSPQGSCKGRWRNSCDKKLEDDIIIVNFPQQRGSYKRLSLSVSRGYWRLLRMLLLALSAGHVSYLAVILSPYTVSFGLHLLGWILLSPTDLD